jgi:hypothetical protein
MTTKPLACWICSKAIDLNHCKTDEQGLPVHGECYVSRIAVKNATQELLPGGANQRMTAT